MEDQPYMYLCAKKERKTAHLFTTMPSHLGGVARRLSPQPAYFFCAWLSARPMSWAYPKEMPKDSLLFPTTA